MSPTDRKERRRREQQGRIRMARAVLRVDRSIQDRLSRWPAPGWPTQPARPAATALDWCREVLGAGVLHAELRACRFVEAAARPPAP